MTKTVAVLGAGMVGVSCALELQRRGWDVALIDKSAPGRETSYGNAGVIARSSLMPMNNPGLWASLPRLARNSSAQLRYNPAFLLRNARWLARFLYSARQACFEDTTASLDSLIRLSADLHRQWLREAGAQARLRTNGWFFLYRSAQAFEASRLTRDTLDKFGVATQVLQPVDIQALEPSLKPIFAKALWIKDAASVDNPGAVVTAYAELFCSRGGRFLRGQVDKLARLDGGWQISIGQEQVLRADQVVVALGPWSRDFLRSSLGLSVPMAYERGYHEHFDAKGGAKLERPIYDTAGGYVLTPMEMGLRMSTGVELADLNAPKNHAQLKLAEKAAREAFPLGESLDAEPWLGRRPTLPDSRPVIGTSSSDHSLWFAFGHQHIGLSTGPGTAVLLADMMSDKKTSIDAAPFAPSRWGL